MPLNSNVVDLIAYSPESNTYTLIMIENQNWNDDPDQLFQLQEKINNYLTFALDGQMYEEYPKAASSFIQLQLNCCQAPTKEVEEFISSVKKIASQENVGFVVKVTT